jgi:hypothetical protein
VRLRGLESRKLKLRPRQLLRVGTGLVLGHSDLRIEAYMACFSKASQVKSSDGWTRPEMCISTHCNAGRCDAHPFRLIR